MIRDIGIWLGIWESVKRIEGGRLKENSKGFIKGNLKEVGKIFLYFFLDFKRL